MTTSYKYGAFTITDGIAQWKGDEEVRLEMQEASSDYCFMEGLWNPCNKPVEPMGEVAVTGLCLWAMHDCIFRFAQVGKGNPGAVRSFASLYDRENVFKRLEKGQKVEDIEIAENPFGPYQIRLMRWQSETVKRLGIKKVYYSLPIDEYLQSTEQLSRFDGWHGRAERLSDMIQRQHDALRWAIRAMIEAEVVFVHPLRHGVTSIEESWTWPYQNLDIDIGIEEMEEVRIAYEVWKKGVEIPPILLGALDTTTPYNQSLIDGEAIKI